MARRKRNKSGRRWLIFAVVAVVVLFACGVLTTAALIAWRLAGGGVPGAGPSLFGAPAGPFAAHMKYLPDNCGSLQSRRMAQLWASPAYQKLRNESGDVKTLETGTDVRWFPVAEVERTTWVSAPTGGDFVITTLTKPVTGEQVRAANSGVAWNTETVNGYTLYTSPGFGVNVVGGGARELGDGFSVVESNVVLFGPGESLRPILRRNGPPKLDANMTKALQMAHFDRSIVHVYATNGGETWLGRDNPFSTEVKLAAPTHDVDIRITETDVDQGVTTTLTYVCKSPAAADNLGRQIGDATQKVVAGKDEAREVYADDKAGVKGPVLTVVMTQSVDAMAKWFHRKVWN
jgi:hypothetical protein